MLLPLVFRSGDVLVYDDLRAVAKISELRFPEDNGILRDD